MTHLAVTDHLLDELVSGSDAEGTTRLAVAAAIEHHDRTLLVETTGDDFGPVWQLPADLVLPGETLLQALARTVGLTTGLGVVDVTGYAGYHDRLAGGEVVRTFVFTVTADDPERICRWAVVGHRWTSDPVTACSVLGDAGGHPTTAAGPTGHLVGPTTLHQLSAALRASAKGLFCAEAAVELLVAQQSWLYRHDFVDRFIGRPTTSQGPAGRSGTASVDWAGASAALDAGRLPCSGAEDSLLRIASSLAEGTPVDLRDALTGLDTVNTGLVARAVCHAAGHRP
jgi:hypothetical protein